MVIKFRGNFYSRVFNFAIFLKIAKNAKLNSRKLSTNKVFGGCKDLELVGHA